VFDEAEKGREKYTLIGAEVEKRGARNVFNLEEIHCTVHTCAHCFIFIKDGVPLQRLLCGASGIGERREIKRGEGMRTDKVKGGKRGEERTYKEEMKVKRTGEKI